MKILISTFSFPPETGGVSEVARVQAHGFAARGHQVTVATEFHPARSEMRTTANVAIRQFKIAGNFRTGIGYRGEVKEFRDFLATEPADIILCHCWQSWATDCAIAAFRNTRARKILLSHGFDAHLPALNRRFPWGIFSWARSLPYVWNLGEKMDAFDQLVFLSRRMDFNRFFDHWLANRLRKKNITVIPNGIHLDQLSSPQPSFRQRYSIQSQFLMLNVANYCDRKNQLETLRAFFKSQRSDSTLVFIGGEFNEYSREMNRLYEGEIRRNPSVNGRVLMLEKIPKETIYAAYQEADLFVLTAKAETQPLVLLDSMGSGVPFISSNVGCVSEFPGGVVAEGTRATANAINALLDNRDWRRELGQKGRVEVIANYSWQRVLDRYEELFARLTGK